MPRVVNIVPKDIYYLLELRLDELKKVKTALDISTMEATNQEEKDAMGYAAGDFYTFVCDCINEVERKEEDGS